MKFLDGLISRLDALAMRILDPTTRINPFALLAVVNVGLGAVALVFAAGTPQEIYQETGIPRYWFPLLCFACATLWRRRTPTLYLVMVLPVGLYALASAYIASIHGSWPDFIGWLLLYFMLLRRWGDVKDEYNGISNVD